MVWGSVEGPGGGGTDLTEFNRLDLPGVNTNTERFCIVTSDGNMID